MDLWLGLNWTQVYVLNLQRPFDLYQPARTILPKVISKSRYLIIFTALTTGEYTERNTRRKRSQAIQHGCYISVTKYAKYTGHQGVQASLKERVAERLQYLG